MRLATARADGCAASFIPGELSGFAPIVPCRSTSPGDSTGLGTLASWVTYRHVSETTSRLGSAVPKRVAMARPPCGAGGYRPAAGPRRCPLAGRAPPHGTPARDPWRRSFRPPDPSGRVRGVHEHGCRSDLILRPWEERGLRGPPARHTGSELPKGCGALALQLAWGVTTRTCGKRPLGGRSRPFAQLFDTGDKDPTIQSQESPNFGRHGRRNADALCSLNQRCAERRRG